MTPLADHLARMKERLERDPTFDMPRRYEHIDRVDLWTLCKEKTTPDLSRLIKALERADRALAKAEERVGMCIFGSSDTSGDPEVAFRQGSYNAWCESGAEAREARAELGAILKGE